MAASVVSSPGLKDPLFAVAMEILHLAQDEYINACGTDSWCETIRTSHEQSASRTSPDPPSSEPEPESAPEFA